MKNSLTTFHSWDSGAVGVDGFVHVLPKYAKIIKLTKNVQVHASCVGKLGNLFRLDVANESPKGGVWPRELPVHIAVSLSLNLICQMSAAYTHLAGADHLPGNHHSSERVVEFNFLHFNRKGPRETCQWLITMIAALIATIWPAAMQQ